MHDEELYSILIGTKLTSNDRSVSLTALFPYYESALRRPGDNMVVLWGEYRQDVTPGMHIQDFVNYSPHGVAKRKVRCTWSMSPVTSFSWTSSEQNSTMSIL